MKFKPIASVLMPVYNCEAFVKDSIESILNQTFANFEFIIVNDGSTDNTMKIIEEYSVNDNRIKILNQSNKGIVSALNRGLYDAKGELIFRMDGDDIALPHRLKIQTDMMLNDSSLVLLGGWCQQINADGKLLKLNKYPTKHENLLKYLETKKAFFPHPTACYRRDVVAKQGGYREKFKHAEDADLWLRLSKYGKIACCNEIVLKLRKHKDNVSNFDRGRPQTVASYAANICYMLNNNELKDPSVSMNEEQWQKYLLWLSNQLEEEGIFQSREARQNLKSIWHLGSEETC